MRRVGAIVLWGAALWGGLLTSTVLGQGPPADRPVNFDFEQGSAGQPPPGWSTGLAYDTWPGARIVTHPVRTGAQAAEVDGRHGPHGLPGVFRQAVNAEPYRGRRVRVSAWLRTDGSGAARAQLWARVDHGFSSTLEHDPPGPEPTERWTRRAVLLDVPVNASILTCGAWVAGEGHAWMDDVLIEAMGPAQAPGGPLIPYEIVAAFAFSLVGLGAFFSLENLAAPWRRAALRAVALFALIALAVLWEMQR